MPFLLYVDIAIIYWKIYQELYLGLDPFLVKQNFKGLVIKCLGKFDNAWQK